MLALRSPQIHISRTGGIIQKAPPSRATASARRPTKPAGVGEAGAAAMAGDLAHDSLLGDGSRKRVSTKPKKLSADVLGSGGGLSLSHLPGQGKPVIDLETKLANREAWHEPWKATSNAALTCDGGGATGYFAAKTPREISLKCADGSRLTLY